MTSSSTSPAGNGGPAFSVSREEHDGEIVLALTGDFDIAAVAPFADATSEIPAGSRVLLDLREVAFMDSSGVRALMNLDVRARAGGFHLARPVPGRACAASSSCAGSRTASRSATTWAGSGTPASGDPPVGRGDTPTAGRLLTHAPADRRAGRVTA
jgi:anti-anti-sigma factor